MKRIIIATIAISVLSAGCGSSPKAASKTTTADQNDTTGTTPPSTKGTTTLPPASFEGDFTPVTAIFEGGSSDINPGEIIVTLLNQNITCTQWQDSTFRLASGTQMIKVYLAANNGSSYDIVDPNGILSGKGFASSMFIGENNANVLSQSGELTVSSFVPRTTFAGALTIDWNNGQTNTVSAFQASFCPDSATFQGAFAPATAFFRQDASSTTIYLLSQNISCADWQANRVTTGTYVWSVKLSGTSAGNYPVTGSLQTNGGYVTEVFDQAMVSSTAGSVNVSRLTPSATLDANIQVTWSNGESASVASFTASYCPQN